MLKQTLRNEILFTGGNGRKTPSARAGMESIKRGRWLRRALMALIVVIGTGMASETGMAAKKAPPIAQPMYLEAYTNMVFRKSFQAIRPLTHLVAADPNLADVQNALALALFVGQPDQLERAHAYAKNAVALAPNVPQFIFTRVLTDGTQWKIEADGTARLTREAAESLIDVAEALLDMSGNAEKLGKLLRSIEQSGSDVAFPYVFGGYKKLLKKPSLALTRPSDREFDVAQKALVDKIFNLRKKLDENKKVAQDESRKAEERKSKIDTQVAEAAERQRKVEEAQARALKKLQQTALETAESTKQFAEQQRQRQLAAGVEQRRLDEARRIAEEQRLRAEEERRIAEVERLRAEEELRIAEETRVAEEIRLAQLEVDLQAKAVSEAERKAEEARIAEARRLVEEARIAEETRLAVEEAKRVAAEQARVAEEKRLAEEEAQRLAEEETRQIAEAKRLVEERRLAIEKEDEARAAREELALIARAAEEARKEQEALELAQQLARAQAEEAELKVREAEAAAQATMLELLEQIEKEQSIIDAMLADEAPVIKVTAWPKSFEIGEGSFRIAGVVGDMDGALRSVTINGESLPLFVLGEGDEKIAAFNNAFRFDITPTEGGDQRFVIEVTDGANNKTATEVVVTITVANRPNIKGKNYALIIGNNVYDNLPTLKTAVFDATAIAEVLQERYDFDDGAIKLLTNATRRDILKALSNFRKNLTTEDRLMLYYAGHGQIDPATDEGFWQPIDSEPENDFTWISNADVKRYLGGIPAKHVLVIADSCFSGSLTRGAETQNDAEDKFFLNIDKYPSRKVIASGGTEPVADAGSEGHSVFAYYLIRTLTNNKKPYITSYQLFEKLVRAVTNNSSQTPEYGTVPNTGDQGAGDFTFILRKGSSG